MRRVCRYITHRFGLAWIPTGWTLFLCWLVLPRFIFWAPLRGLVEGLLDLLLLCWWFVDMGDQHVPHWAVSLGTLLVLTGLLPHWSLLTLLAWILYWIYIR